MVKLSDLLPRRHPVKCQEDTQTPPFFILGSGRNGSTLLSALLNQHPELMIPPEQWVLYEMIIKYKLFNFHSWNDLVNLMLGLIADPGSNEGWATDFTPLYTELKQLSKEDRCLQEIIDAIYSLHGDQQEQQFECWGEKSPINTVYLKFIYPVYPDSQYIFLLRDGRDVVSSMVKNNNREINFAIWKWKHSIRMYRWIRKRVSEDQLLLVRYEDLVRQPESTLKKLTQFLNISFSKNILNHQGSLDYLNVREMQHHQNLQNPLSSTSIGKWEKRLSEKEKEYLLPRLENLLGEFGYL